MPFEPHLFSPLCLDYTATTIEPISPFRTSLHSKPSIVLAHFTTLCSDSLVSLTNANGRLVVKFIIGLEMKFIVMHSLASHLLLLLALTPMHITEGLGTKGEVRSNGKCKIADFCSWNLFWPFSLESYCIVDYSGNTNNMENRAHLTCILGFIGVWHDVWKFWSFYAYMSDTSNDVL